MSLELIVSDLAKDKQVAVKSSFKEFLEKADEYSKIIDGIEIKDVDDKEGLTNARQARLFLKNQRGDMKRLTESKRNEIKAAKLEWDLLDKGYLKAFQFVEEIYKSLESKAEDKEKYVERLEEERKERVRMERWEQLSKYMDFEPEGLKVMTDEVFSHVLKGAKADYQERIEAEKKAEEERLEAERIENLHQDRKESLIPYWGFVSEDVKPLHFGRMKDDDFIKISSDAIKEKDKHEKEQAKIKAENERLKKEEEDRKKEAEKEYARVEAIKATNKNKAISALKKMGFDEKDDGMNHSVHHYFIGFNHISEFDNDQEFESAMDRVQKYIEDKDTIKALKDKEEKEAEARKAKEEVEAKQRAIEEAKRKAELDKVRNELEAERIAKKAIEDAKAKEEADRIKREEEAKKAPDKKKIQNAIQELSLPVLELNPDSKPTYDEILDKFSKFKVWANTKINEL